MNLQLFAKVFSIICGWFFILFFCNINFYFCPFKLIFNYIYIMFSKHYLSYFDEVFGICRLTVTTF